MEPEIRSVKATTKSYLYHNKNEKKKKLNTYLGMKYVLISFCTLAKTKNHICFVTFYCW